MPAVQSGIQSNQRMITLPPAHNLQSVSSSLPVLGRYLLDSSRRRSLLHLLVLAQTFLPTVVTCLRIHFGQSYRQAFIFEQIAGCWLTAHGCVRSSSRWPWSPVHITLRNGDKNILDCGSIRALKIDIILKQNTCVLKHLQSVQHLVPLHFKVCIAPTHLKE